MKKLFAIMDVKAGSFFAPFSDDSSVNAIRGFDIGVNEGKSMFSKFPDDYALFELGSFDPSNGSIETLAAPTRLCTGREVFRSDSDSAKL